MNKVTATWTAAEGATSYNVYLDEALIKNTTELSLSFPLSDFAAHVVKVAGVNDRGEGIAASANVPALPGAITDLKLTFDVSISGTATVKVG